MRFTKPAWVLHKDATAPRQDQNPKRLSIFSIHVHPDGSRIATGGLDAKIRIWSTKPILNEASEASGRPPKSLCTLTMHTGPVLTVRWAHSGRWLASGSDDEIVMIWDLDPTARGKVWGSDDVNVEGWKPLKRLPGHESDVTDVAWSPGDRYLASVGLDSQVIIWCGYTLERLRKLDQHQGFVKGVCWDPVGEFLATQSDDRSVKIWRTTDWQLEAEVRKPFEDSPGSTFFRRLSWSPDGAHITASNATNNKGFVFIAAVITRNTWTSEISLVGHENTIEVASYNPHIFLRNPQGPIATANICSVVALGADDRSVSIWQTKSARPLIVAKEVFERQIMDLSWSWDGLTLYAASSDGTIAVFDFDSEELEGIAPHSVQEQYLQKFGFQPPPDPQGLSHGATSTASPLKASRSSPPPSPSSRSMSAAPAQTAFGGMANGSAGGERINQLVAKRSNKKRIQPSFVGSLGGSVPSASTSSKDRPLLNSASAEDVTPRSFGTRTESKGDFFPPSRRGPSPNSLNHILNHDPFGVQEISRDVTMDVDMTVPIDALDTNDPSGSTAGRKSFAEDNRLSKPRTLGGDKPRESVVAREIANGTAGRASTSREWSESHAVAGVLPILPLMTSVSAKVDGSEDVFEGRNFENNEPTEVMFVSGKQIQWLDYLPSPVTAVEATTYFCAAAMQDGFVNVYSRTGRRLLPTLTLGSPCSIMSSAKHMLMVLSSSGQLFSWNIKKQAVNFPPISIFPLLSTSPNCTVDSALVMANGAPVIQCTTGVAYSYDPDLLTWVKLTERWWSEGSDAWQGRQRANSTTANRGVVYAIEGYVAGGPSGVDKQRPAWWNTALTLGHLETRLNAARLLNSPAEYKQALLVYVKKIADEGFRAKGEELIKELFGPVYWRPAREDVWNPTLMGMSKRDLLKDVLSIFARSKTLTKLALDWQDLLKKATNDEQ